jgi:hypothetical protein
MNNSPPLRHSSSIDAIFKQLKQRDIEEFYTGYQCWNLLQQITALQTRIGELHQQIAENTQRMQEVQPTAIALATLARLQSNGVSDIELLDRMLEQGELWLDRTMQRLEYLEQLDDFISEDYSQWCRLALEGAYDWIDSMLEGAPPLASPAATSKEEKLTEATEELFLQKLSSEECDDETSLLETTLKRPALTIAHQSELSLSSKNMSVAEGHLVIVETTSTQVEAFPEDGMTASTPSVEEDFTHENVEAGVTQKPEEELTYDEHFTSVEETSGPNAGQPLTKESVEDTPVTSERPAIPPETLQENEKHPATKAALFESKAIEIPSSNNTRKALVQHQPNKPQRRPNLIRRFIGIIWGSEKS